MPGLRLVLIILIAACSVHLGQSQSPSDITYLYYFESDDADLRQANSKTYAFVTLPSEKVSLVVYGLDGRLQPRLTLRTRSGEEVMTSAPRQEQAHIVAYQFTASSNELYYAEVSRAAGESGIARFMLFADEPLNQDITLLDNINPLLPSRAFLVAGRDEAEGLRARVETLIVPRFRQRPMVFASRGAFDELPPREERQQPAEIIEWFNDDGQRVYTINVRATPEEELTLASAEDFRLLNVGNGFYFDYYLTIGAGSDPVQLLREDDCASFPDREGCILSSATLGREPLEDFRPDVREAPEEDLITDLQPIATPDPFDIEPVPCPDGSGIVETLSLPGVLVGSDCSDVLGGSTGDDFIRGAGGSDVISGNDGRDELYGEGSNDDLNGGAGDDELYGGDDNDTLEGGTGSDTLDGGDGFDYVSYQNDTAGVDIDLSSGTGSDGSGGTDTLLGLEGIIGSAFDDTLTGDANTNIIFGEGGDDEIDLGAGNNQTAYGGAGNDTFQINDNQASVIYGGLNSNDLNSGDDTLIFADGLQATIRFIDSSGRDTLDFSSILGSVNFNAASTALQTVTPGLSFSVSSTSTSSSQVLDIFGTGFNDILSGTNRNIAGQDDRIYAGAGDDLLFASFGDDLLDGGAGSNDTVNYNDYGTRYGVGVIADLTLGLAIKSGTQDTLVNIENLVGTAFNDSLTGDDNANTLSGLNGSDILDGRGGDDTLLGGDGSDIIDGGDGADLLDGGIGNDNLNGGMGIDTATYAGATSSVNVNLELGTAVGGAGSDALNSIENVIGSAFNDTLRGDANDNRIEGGAGNDIVVVTAGSDTASGGAQVFTSNTSACPSPQCGWGDLLDASSLNVATTVTITGTSGTLTNASGTTTFDGFERIYTSSGSDTFNLSGALSPLATTPLSPTEWLTVGRRPGSLGADVDTFNFSGVGTGTTGYIQINNSVSDQVLFDASFNLNPNNTTSWQEVAPDLFIRLSNALNPTCPSAASVDNYIYNDLFVGDLWNTFGTCTTNDIYNGSQFFLSPLIDTVSYNGNASGTGQVDLGDDHWLEYNVGAGGTANRIVVQRVGGSSIGTDQLIKVEGVIGTSLGADIFRFNDLVTAWGDPTQPRPLYLNGAGWDATSNRMDTLDFTNVASNVFVDLANIGGIQNAYTNMQLVLQSAFGTLIGGSGSDVLFGNNLDNIIRDGAGVDQLFGLNGDDTLESVGDAFLDFFDGGNGNDTFSLPLAGPPIAATVTLGAADTVTTGGAADTLSSFERLQTANGNDTFNIATAIEYVDGLLSGGGDDQWNIDGDDFGGSGTLNGEGGTDTLNFSDPLGTFATTFQPITFTINGGVSTTFSSALVTNQNFTNFERIVGGAAADTFNIINSNFFNLLDGGAGNDTFNVNDMQNSSLSGGLGFDRLNYQHAAALRVVVGAAGGSACEGAAGCTGPWTDTFNNFEAINLQGGNDTIVYNGGLLNLTVNSGAGNDAFQVNADGFNNTFNGGTGTDTLTFTNAANVIINGGTVGLDTLISIESITGSGAADTFNVVDATPYTSINGGGGNDTFNVTADATSNIFNGGAGTDNANYSSASANLTINYSGASASATDGVFTDTLNNFENFTTGSGTDTFNVTADATNNTFNGGAGTDSVNYSSAVDLTVTIGVAITVDNGLATDTLNDVENFTSGGGNDDLTLNAAGGTGAGNSHVVDGGAGDDTFSIGAGLSGFWTFIGTAGDTLDFSSATQGITIDLSDTTNHQDVYGNNSLLILLQGIFNAIIGTAQIDDISGTSGDDTIDAGGNDDVVDGGAGDDTIDGGTGADRLVGGAGNDTLNGGTGDDTLIGGLDNASTCPAAPAPADGDDVLNGEGGDDVLYGGSDNEACVNGSDDGSDTLDGGIGSDELYGGNNNSNGGAGDDGSDTLDGGADDDTLVGGNNNSNGGAGDDLGSDILSDSDTAGQDTLVGGNDNTTNGTGDDGLDTITSTDSSTVGSEDTIIGGNDNTGGGTGTDATAPDDTIAADGGDTVNADNQP